MYVLITVGIC